MLRKIDIFKEIEAFTSKYNKMINYADQYVFNFLLHLPKSIGYSSIEAIHLNVMSLLKRIKKSYKINILVIGSSNFIGWYFKTKLLEMNFDITLLERNIL